MRITGLKLTARLENGDLVEVSSPEGAVSDLEISEHEDLDLQSLSQYTDYSVGTRRFVIGVKQTGFSAPLTVRVVPQ